MNLLINLPTRSRPEKCLSILEEYQRLSTYENTRYVISCDEDDETMNNYKMIELIGSKKNTQIIFNENKINVINPNTGRVEKSKFTTKIQAINSGVKKQKFDICLLASDDMHPESEGYDLDIVNDMKKFFPNTDGVLWYNDGYKGDELNTLCILGKKYYDRFGYIYHPSYITLYCDDEFTRVSKALGKCQYIDKTIIRHKHWSHGDNENSRDILDHKNDVFAGYDQQNFKQRKLKGFNLKVDSIEDELIQIRPYWDAHNNFVDVNRWSRVHPRFLDHEGCVVDLGCLGWNRDFNDITSDNWAGYFFDKKRVIGVDPQESQNSKADFFKGFVSDFNGKASLEGGGISGAILPDPNGTYDVLSWKQFKTNFNIEEISILKVNIEGSEIQLFNDFSKSDFDKIDQIAVSFHDWLYPDITEACKSCVLNIINHGYECIDLGIYGWKLFLKKY